MIVDQKEYDEGEPARRDLLEKIRREAGERPALEEKHGKVWTTDELVEEFEVVGFMAPFVNVRRKSDGKSGSLEFQHRPRLYWGWKEDR